MKDPSVRGVVNLSAREVSCRVVRFVLEQTEKRGIRSEELFEGLSYPAEHLANKHARIDWTTFRELMSRVGQRLTDPELVELGRDAAQERWAWPFRAVGSLVRSRPAPWRRSRPRAGPSSALVACLRSTVREIETNRYEIVLRMDEGYEPSRELFIATQGFFREAPRLLGLGSAEVELEERERGVRYEIRLTSGGRFRGWLRWAATRPFAMGAARELREGLEFLEAGYLELEDALAERIEIEEELRLSEERYRTITENLHDLIVEIDPERWRLTYASPNHRDVLGFEPTEVQSMYDLERVHPEDRASLSHAFLDLVRKRGSGRFSFRIQHRDGRWLWFESFARSVQRASGEPRVVLVSRDITEKRRAEHELRSSEERLRRLTENARDLIDEIDQEGRFAYVGPNHRTITGFRPEELYGESPFDHIHPDDRERVREGFGSLLRTGAAEPQLFRFLHRDGRWLWFETQASRVSTPSGETRIVTVTRDVTHRLKEQEEKRRLESQIRLTQKLESLGVLAGGIAHDFNNLLTPILGNADRGLSEVEPGSPAAVSLERIRSASLRAAELANQLLVYAGENSLTARALDLSEVTRRMASLLDLATSPKATLGYRFAQGLPPIKADVGQIQQVILNLITNASEAIGDRPGVISVRTGAMEVDRAYLARATLGSNAEPGSYVYLEVVDTGCGMDEGTKARIFDPFYTTKVAGRGLGLAALLGIVRAHDGVLELTSEPGRGTQFRVLFPCAEGAVEAEPDERPVEPAWRGSGTILVVEDDEDVRAVSRWMLESVGFSVATADDGKKGIDLFRQDADRFTAVLLDLAMPQISGEEVLHELRQIRPGIPIVLCSGYGDARVTQRLTSSPGTRFLPKPYERAELLETLRELLEPATA